MIRLWILGDLEKGVIPGKEAIEKLRAVLSEGMNDGIADVVWGPDLRVYLVDEVNGKIIGMGE